MLVLEHGRAGVEHAHRVADDGGLGRCVGGLAVALPLRHEQDALFLSHPDGHHLLGARARVGAQPEPWLDVGALAEEPDAQVHDRRDVVPHGSPDPIA